MTDSRARILERIRLSTAKRNPDDTTEAAFQALCREQQNDVVQPEQDMMDIVSTFCSEAQRNGAEVEHFTRLPLATQWVLDQAAASEVTPSLHLSPWVQDAPLDWHPLRVSGNTPEATHSWGVIKAHTAIAETGTLVSVSTECPSGLLFLVERLIVLIDKQTIVAYQEDAWRRLELEPRPPRTVNLITGPSRTADIEQRIQIGAHGPRRTDYLIIDSLDD